MSMKAYIAAAVVAAGVLGFADRAQAQWRRGAFYSTPSYYYPSYYTPSYYSSYYSPSVVTSSYSTPTYYTSRSGVVVSSSYSMPSTGTVVTSPDTVWYTGSPYMGGSYYDPYAGGYYPSGSYYGGYSNLYGNPYGVGVGTRGGAFLGRRAWRW